jgi:transglutaminase-like putative cysteine protease
MKLKVQHKVSYQYSHKVYLEPHKLYLLPRIHENAVIEHYQLNILPKPSVLAKNTDVEGNRQWLCYFEKQTESFEIESNFIINNSYQNPFDFVYFPFERKGLPMKYSATELHILAPYLNTSVQNTTLEYFARNLAAQCQWNTTKFLVGLNAKINTEFTYTYREQGQANAAETTLLSQSGSCRDFANLFIACCQIVGLAARFVSGYLYQAGSQNHNLHAWAEVYLPGGGWRGFDPTQNQAFSQNHITLAASAYPNEINPVIGSFRGNAQAEMLVKLQIEALD